MKHKKVNQDEISGMRTVIEPNGKNFQYWKDIWRYRELAFNLAKRDITVRYKQTVIGLGWSIINPIINMFRIRSWYMPVSSRGRCFPRILQ